MRYQGRIQQWQDEKGFGFVEPNGGGVTAFVHIRAFAAGSRRPIEGDLVTYRAEKDAQGRWRAADVRYARLTRDTATTPHQGRRATGLWAGFGGVYLLAIAAICTLGRWPWAVLGIVAGASVLAFLAYWNDKRAAQSGGWRTPEAHLHLVALIGGWPGAALAQHRLRHKSKKPSFRFIFGVTVVLNLIATAWLFSTAGLAFLVAVAGA